MSTADQSLPLQGLELLETYRVGSLPSLYLIPDYISDALQQQLLSNITSSKQNWKQVSGRKLQNLGGVVSAKGGLIPAPMPSWLQPIADQVSTQLSLYGDPSTKANHVLINSYAPGDGIMPHTDGPLYYSTVAILSLGSHAVIRFSSKRSDNDDNGDDTESGGAVVASVIVPPKSLLVFKDQAYEECLHGIDFVSEELLDSTVVNLNAADESLVSVDSDGSKRLKRDGIRTSLTIRRVLKVHAALGLLLKK